MQSSKPKTSPVQNDIPGNIKVLFIAGFGPIVSDHQTSKALYVNALRIPLEEMANGYLHTSGMDGAKHFALWPLSEAAKSCFGTDTWPKHVPTPQAWLEFDVDDIDAATKELEHQGYDLLLSAKTESWGQTVTRFLSPEGILLAVTHTPSLRGD
jgi:hypothetical protein